MCSLFYIANCVCVCNKTFIEMICKHIKTHGRVSAAKKDVRHTSVLFIITGTTKSPFSTLHISITTGPICIKFTYFMPSIYTTVHTKFEENQISGLWDIRIWKLHNFFTFFFFFAPICNNNFKPRKNWMDFFQIWYANKEHSVPSSPKIGTCLS